MLKTKVNAVTTKKSGKKAILELVSFSATQTKEAIVAKKKLWTRSFLSMPFVELVSFSGGERNEPLTSLLIACLLHTSWFLLCYCWARFFLSFLLRYCGARFVLAIIYLMTAYLRIYSTWWQRIYLMMITARPPWSAFARLSSRVVVCLFIDTQERLVALHSVLL